MSNPMGSRERRGGRRKGQTQHESKFVDHLLSCYPLLDDLFDTYHKRAPKIIQLPFSLGCDIGNKVVTPFIPSPKEHPIIKQLDDLGDHILDAIDNTVPIITYPAEDIKHVVIEEPLTQAYDALVCRPVNTVRRTRETYQDFLAKQAKKAVENIDRDIVPLIGALTDPYVEIINNVLEEQVHARTSGLKGVKEKKQPGRPYQEMTTVIGEPARRSQQHRDGAAKRNIPSHVTLPGKMTYSEALAMRVGIDDKAKEIVTKDDDEGLERAQQRIQARQAKRKKTSPYTGVTRDEIELERTLDIIVSIITDLLLGAKRTAEEAQEAAQAFRGNVSGAAGTVREQAQQTADDLRNRAGMASKRAHEQVRETVGKGTQQAKEYTRRAVETAKSVVNQGLQATEAGMEKLREGVHEGREEIAKMRQVSVEDVVDEGQEQSRQIYESVKDSAYTSMESAKEAAKPVAEKGREFANEGLRNVEKGMESVEWGIESGKKDIERAKKMVVEQEAEEGSKKIQEKAGQIAGDAKRKGRIPTPENRPTPERRETGERQSEYREKRARRD